MTNNDILRRLRYVFDFNDAKMIAIFALVDVNVRRGHIVAWLVKDDDPTFEACKDHMLAAFLNGLIDDKRGRKEGAMRTRTEAHKQYYFNETKDRAGPTVGKNYRDSAASPFYTFRPRAQFIYASPRTPKLPRL